LTATGAGHALSAKAISSRGSVGGEFARGADCAIADALAISCKATPIAIEDVQIP
jgi:hypothetical protein